MVAGIGLICFSEISKFVANLTLGWNSFIFVECLKNLIQYSKFGLKFLASKNCRQEWFFFSMWKLIVNELNSFITKLHIDIFILKKFWINCHHTLFLHVAQKLSVAGRVSQPGQGHYGFCTIRIVSKIICKVSGYIVWFTAF